MKKFQLYSRADIGWFIVYSFFVTIAMKEIMQNSSFCVPTNYTIIAESVFLLLIAICFIFTIYSHKCIIAKETKSEEDIKKRQKIVRRMTILIAILFNSIPFLLDSWGVNILYDSNKLNYNTQLPVYLNFINSGIRISFVVTIAVFFADNFLNRISSEIYTYDDIKGLNKFCLYLRSFNADNNFEEKMICRTLQNLYPVYAIGDPNKLLQPNGAERIYVTDEIWQYAVKYLSMRSNLIILRLGKTDGTIWEILNIMNSNLMQKVIFLAYTQEDYNHFANILSEKFEFDMPSLDIFNKYPIAFYFVEDSDSLILKRYRIKTTNDIECMLNEYLKNSPELDKVYSVDLELRNASFKSIFEKDYIPETVRKSFNWGVISPIINMRHWPLFMWGIFLVSLFVSVIIQNIVPIFLYLILMFVFGNRIEWLSKGWSCESLFLRHQRREAKILWLSVALGVLYSIIYSFMHLMLT